MRNFSNEGVGSRGIFPKLSGSQEQLHVVLGTYLTEKVIGLRLYNDTLD
jgi:hypothetical protein